MLITILRRIVEIVLKMFKSNQSKKDNNYKRTEVESFGNNLYADDHDYVSDMLNQTGSITENKNKSEEAVAKMSVENHMLETITTYRENNIISVIIPESSNKISTISVVTTESFEELEFLVMGNKLSAVSKITYSGHKIYLTCSHVIQMINHDSLEDFYDVNPMICVKKHKILENKFKFKVTPKMRVIWYTKGIEKNKHAYIETEVYDVITCPVQYYSTNTLMVIAIIVAIQPDEVYVTSGTLMSVDNKPYIVTYRKVNTKGVLYLIAVAPLVHNYRIQIV